MRVRKEDIDELQSQIFNLATCCKLMNEKTQLMQEEIKELKSMIKDVNGMEML